MAVNPPLPRPEQQTKQNLGKREYSDVDAQEGEVPKAAARPPQRQGLARWQSGIWGIWTEGHGMRLDHRPPDRSLSGGHHPLYQAWWQAVDPYFSGQALHQKTCGNSHG